MGFRLSRPEFKEGFYFAVSQASQTIYNDLDKTMLVRLGGLEATGIYGAAYRIVDVSFAPVGALTQATLARFFRHGERHCRKYPARPEDSALFCRLRLGGGARFSF